MSLKRETTKTVLMTGTSSLLGSAIIKTKPEGYKLIACFNSHPIAVDKPQVKTEQLGLLDKNSLKNILATNQPDVLIHAAALSDVDYCQNHQDQAWKTNVQGTRNIAEVCSSLDIPIIFISTNALFDGSKPSYSETDLPNPLNFYGQTKLEAEKIIQNGTDKWTIVRLITMYGWQPENARLNPVTWVLNELEARHSVKVVGDVWLNPLYYLDGGQVIWKLIDSQAKGIWHVAGSQTLNRYDWAKKTAQIFKLDSSLISPISSSFFSGKIAPRPQRTVYSTAKLNNKLGYQTKNISEGLKAMFKEKRLRHVP